MSSIGLISQPSVLKALVPLEGHNMRYMLLVYTNEAEIERATPELMNQVAEGHRRVMEEARRAGIFVAADPLASTAAATTVRLVDGRSLVTDGPFAETKEQLAGYYILECRNIDEAIEWAQKLPTECGGAVGSVEIRPLRFQKHVS
jgi:hypothetical protein